jgi:hypothetical protein
MMMMIIIWYMVDAPENDGNSSIAEQVKRPNPWRKMMMVNNMIHNIIK